MKIGEGTPINSKAANSVPAAIPYRTGDVVVVQIQSVESTGDVSLKFPNGETLTSVLKNRFGGQDGDFLTIKIQGNNENKIYAEIVRNQDNLRVNKNTIAFLLSRINIANSPENYSIASQMVRSGILLNEENFKTFIKQIRQYSGLQHEQIAFMLKHGIPFNSDNIEIVTSLMQHEKLIGNELLLLFQLVLSEKGKTDFLKKLLRNFYNDPSDENFDYDQLKSDKTIKNLIETLLHAQSQNNFDKESKNNINSFLNRVQAQYEIINKLQYMMAYLQIPININGNYNTAELYVLKDNKNNYENKNNQSIFIRIPTSKMGILEFFISIDYNKNIECHLNAQESDYISHIKNNILLLYELLADIGYHLIKVTYNQIPTDISLNNFQMYSDLITGKKGFNERM